MTRLDIAFMLTYGIFVLVGLAVCVWAMRVGGRDRPRDPEAVDRFIAQYRGRFPADERLTRGEANSRGLRAPPDDEDESQEVEDGFPDAFRRSRGRVPPDLELDED